MKPSGIVSFYNVPDDAGDPDVKVYVNNELVETGGGGSDDLTAAKLTVNIPQNNAKGFGTIATVYAACINGNETTSYYEIQQDDETVTVDIVLYKGAAYVEIDTASYSGATVSGDITEISTFHYTMSGDGVINLTE